MWGEVSIVTQTKSNIYEISDRSKVVNGIDSISTNPIPAMYQSGYLTIKGYDERFKKYLLGFPNREVEEGFFNFLLPLYTSAGDSSREA